MVRVNAFLFLFLVVQSLFAADCDKYVESIVDAEAPANANQILAKSEFARFARALRIVHSYLQCLIPPAEFRDTNFDRHVDMVKQMEVAGLQRSGSFANPELNKTTYTLCRDVSEIKSRWEAAGYAGSYRRFNESAQIVNQICDMRLRLMDGSSGQSSEQTKDKASDAPTGSKQNSKGKKGASPSNQSASGKGNQSATTQPGAQTQGSDIWLEQMVNDYFLISTQLQAKNDQNSLICGDNETVFLEPDRKRNPMVLNDQFMEMIKRRRIPRNTLVFESEAERRKLDRQHANKVFSTIEIEKYFIEIMRPRVNYLSECANKEYFRPKTGTKGKDRELADKITVWVARLNAGDQGNQTCSGNIDPRSILKLDEILTRFEFVVRRDSDINQKMPWDLKASIQSFRASKATWVSNYCELKGVQGQSVLVFNIKKLSERLELFSQANPEFQVSVGEFNDEVGRLFDQISPRVQRVQTFQDLLDVIKGIFENH